MRVAQTYLIPLFFFAVCYGLLLTASPNDVYPSSLFAQAPPPQEEELEADEDRAKALLAEAGYPDGVDASYAENNPDADPRVLEALEILALVEESSSTEDTPNAEEAADADTPADTPVPEEELEADEDRAKALLAEAGYPDGVDASYGADERHAGTGGRAGRSPHA